MKRTGKGCGITINSEFTSTLNRFKGCMANVSEGVQVREFKPYKVPKAMQDQVERCKELTAWTRRPA